MSLASTHLQTTSGGNDNQAAGRKKILLISGFRIFPMNTGGHVRTGGIAHALARLGHEVLLYSLAGRKADYSGPRESGRLHRASRIETLAPNLVEETNLGWGYGLMQTIGRRFDFPRRWQYQMLNRGWLPGRLKDALQRADVILSDMPWCPPIPGPWSSKPWFMISHNLEYRLLEQGNARHRKWAAWMRQIESEAPQRYLDIFPCAEEDSSFFREHDPHRRLLLPMIRCGVDPGAYAVPEGTRQRVRARLGLKEGERLLIFSGSGYGPNVEALAALREFCRAEAQFLERAQLRILALGSVAAEPWTDGALSATGRVPEVAPYFAAADAGLNPITRGSGANVKLFEYLAARLPVISTPFGVRGTQLKPDADFLSFELPVLKQALERFATERSLGQWRAHADQVWERHRSSCDIEELVKTAIDSLPAFAA